MIDNTGDYNDVKKIGDRCRFAGCKGKVAFKGIENVLGKMRIILRCKLCGVEHCKGMKK